MRITNVYLLALVKETISMKARTFTLMIIAVLIGAMALAGTASDIDNCCFVDRQCHSDQQWIDGYHAFQNNQCSAPAQSQPAGGAPAQIDNCCYVDRQCSTDQDWIKRLAGLSEQSMRRRATIAGAKVIPAHRRRSRSN